MPIEQGEPITCVVKAKFILFVEKTSFDLYNLHVKGDRTYSAVEAYGTISRAGERMQVAGLLNGLFLEQAVEIRSL